MGFSGFSLVKNLPADARDTGSIPGLGRSFGEGNGHPLQYSCLGNPVNRGVWGTTNSPWGRKRIGHVLATEQQQKCFMSFSSS